MDRMFTRTPQQTNRPDRLFLTAFFFLFLVWFADTNISAAQSQRPNIIFILADDLGYGDLSAYGQKLFQTPNIDKLATEGLKFTSHYSGSPVCAPSRSALMTGLHSGHTYIRGNKEVQPEGQWPLPSEAFTLTEMLKGAGYVTGVFGKWGLGYPGSEGDPHSQGVDTFFGYNCQRLAHNYYPTHLWDNNEKILLSGNQGTDKEAYAPELIHREAMKFLEGNKGKPFFLFYPMVFPHAELVAPEQYMKRFRGKYLPEKNFEGVDEGEPDFRQGPYASQKEAHAAFAAMITMMDDQVGDIMQKVSSLGLDEKTIIIFSSDNGPHVEGGADPDYFDSNGILRGYKRDVYEGGVRVPMIARWAGVIRPGTETEHVSAFWDVMPTLAELLNLEVPDNIDGVSFLPTLVGNKRSQQQHQYLYWEFHELGGRRAVRVGDWKLVQYNVEKNPPGPFELYNVRNDPGEKTDLASKYPKRVEDMLKIMLSAHTPSEDFKFAAEKN
jgi:arylsulfatase A-like enzyme